jgi:hypothetical protein
MTQKKQFWIAQIILVAVAIFSVFGADLLSSRAPDRTKRLSLLEIGGSDAFFELRHLSPIMNLSLTIDGRPATNLYIANAHFQNPGTNAITEDDYSEPLTVSIPPPWQILAVASSEILPDVQINWSRVDDQTFSGGTPLINPGDSFSPAVYLTNPAFAPGEKTPPGERVYPRWRVRVKEMREIEIRSIDDLLAENPFQSGVSVALSGWSLVFVLSIAPSLFISTLYLARRAALLPKLTIPVVLTLTGASLLSFASAEATATYLFPPLFVQFTWLTHLLNIPFIAIQTSILAYLYYLVRSSSTNKTRPITEQDPPR